MKSLLQNKFYLGILGTRETAALGGVSLALPECRHRRRWKESIWGSFSGGKEKIGPPSAPQIVLRLPQGHEDSEYVLSFEIGQREVISIAHEQTGGQNHPVPY